MKHSGILVSHLFVLEVQLENALCANVSFQGSRVGEHGGIRMERLKSSSR
jgi:hypothetical protein